MRWPGGLVAACAALGIAPGTMAATPVVAAPTEPAVAVTSIPVRITGAVSVQFHGDPAAGCARWGLCGYSGTVSWQPSQSNLLSITRTGGRHPKVVIFMFPAPASESNLPGGLTTASVALAGPGAPRSAGSHCADATAEDQGPTFATRHGRVIVSMASASPTLLATRCAGPRGADVLQHVPVRVLSMAVLERGRTDISLAAVHALDVHGLTGSITSTLVLHVGRPGRTHTERNPGLPGPAKLGREIDVAYRATVTGNVIEQDRGAADPLECAPLGSCGVLGTIALLPHVHSTLARLVVVGRAGTPRNELLAAAGLARGRPSATDGITAFGEVAWRGGGSVRSDLTQGAERCRDVAPMGPGALLMLTSRRGWSIRMTADEPFGAPGAVTRCPGPMPATGLFAGATVPLRALDPRTTRIALTTGSTVHDDGYRVRFMPHLTLTLTRLRVRMHTVRLAPEQFASP